MVRDRIGRRPRPSGADAKLIALVQGSTPSRALVAAGEALGVRIQPASEPPLDPALPRLLIAAASEATLAAGLRPPFSGFIETSDGEDPGLHAECVEAAACGGLCISVTTVAAFAYDVTAALGMVVGPRFNLGDDCVGAIELALGEAIGNAVIHGNLGIASDLRSNLDLLAAFNALVGERLASPFWSKRRVFVTIAPEPPELRVTVRDQGDGWDLASQLSRPVEAEAKSGRGLGLIRQLARSVIGADQGRALTMRFADPG
jgi:anti-sigma regulatory factor (Ser/Thr protein kinase)